MEPEETPEVGVRRQKLIKALETINDLFGKAISR